MADLTLYRGNDTVANVTVTNPDGTPMNISAIKGATLLAKEFVGDPDGDAILVKTLVDGITVIDGTAGTLQIAFKPADTKSTRDSLPYALNIVSALSEVKTIASGYVRFVRTAVLGN